MKFRVRPQVRLTPLPQWPSHPHTQRENKDFCTGSSGPCSRQGLLTQARSRSSHPRVIRSQIVSPFQCLSHATLLAAGHPPKGPILLPCLGSHILAHRREESRWSEITDSCCSHQPRTPPLDKSEVTRSLGVALPGASMGQMGPSFGRILPHLSCAPRVRPL